MSNDSTSAEEKEAIRHLLEMSEQHADWTCVMEFPNDDDKKLVQPSVEMSKQTRTSVQCQQQTCLIDKSLPIQNQQPMMHVLARYRAITCIICLHWDNMRERQQRSDEVT